MASSDPTVVRSIAVTIADLVAAVEMNQTSGKHAVLRVTPPFSGRMRARLHVERSGEYESEPAPLHVEPDDLLEDPPSYPRPAETEDELREDPEETYTVERHHERHRAAVQEWRETIPNRVSNSVTLRTTDGDRDVSVTLLGDDDTLDDAF
jgi:hypothetical protein